MFDPHIYQERRDRLKKQVGSGLILLLGNEESPMNYADNGYAFRQDSNFLYFFGLDLASLAAVIDVDSGKDMLFGNDFTIDQIVWMGPQPLLKDEAARVAVKEVFPLDKLQTVLNEAANAGRDIHFLPPYRAQNKLKLENLLGIHPNNQQEKASVKLIKAIVEQRSVKADIELTEIEKALDISYEMHTAAMKATKPGMYEREIAGLIEGIALQHGGMVSYPVILTINGQTLHNHYHGNQMQNGRLVLNDSGAESPSHYASDLTRTFPVSGTFTPIQKDIYNLVLDAEERCIDAVKPGIRFKDIHLMAGKILLQGLKDMGLVKGDIDEAVQLGVQAMFFQCGLGHMMGLDVHDMEDLGEKYTGYDPETPRSEQFGLCYLRLARALDPGNVITVEPGIYFIPELIDRWRAEKRFTDFLNYDKIDAFRDFGGARVEDNLVVTENGYKILGKVVPKTVPDIEAITGTGL